MKLSLLFCCPAVPVDDNEGHVPAADMTFHQVTCVLTLKVVVGFIIVWRRRSISFYLITQEAGLLSKSFLLKVGPCAG